MTPQWATVLLSVLALAFSIYSGIRANGKTDRKDAEEAGKQESAVMMKLEVVQNTLLEVKQDIKSQKLEMEKMNERTIRNEESLKSLHKRVDRMEALLQLSPDAVTTTDFTGVALTLQDEDGGIRLNEHFDTCYAPEGE